MTGDITYLDDLAGIIKQQLSPKGLDTYFSKDSLLHQNNKLILNNLDLDVWFKDIRSEVQNNENFYLNVLRAPEVYPFLTNLK
jgi:hypothetical protein